jgi:thymidylate kinase
MIKLIAIKSVLKKIAAWCKKYWQILLGILIPIIIMLLTRDTTVLKRTMSRISEDYDKEIDAIEKAHNAEIEARDRADRRYRDALLEIEERFEENFKSLDKEKARLIKKLIADNDEDPEEITRRISEITGFSIHVD